MCDSSMASSRAAETAGGTRSLSIRRHVRCMYAQRMENEKEIKRFVGVFEVSGLQFLFAAALPLLFLIAPRALLLALRPPAAQVEQQRDQDDHGHDAAP